MKPSFETLLAHRSSALSRACCPYSPEELNSRMRRAMDVPVAKHRLLLSQILVPRVVAVILPLLFFSTTYALVPYPEASFYRIPDAASIEQISQTIFSLII